MRALPLRLSALAAALGLAATPAATPAAGAEPARKRVAVLEFQGALPAENLQVVTDSARVGALEAANALGLLVMTRESMAAILNDMGRELAACTGGECEVDTGRLVGADVIVTGTVASMAGRWVVTVKAHETKGGALLRSEQVATQEQFQLLASVKEATRRCLDPRSSGGPVGAVVYQLPKGRRALESASAAMEAAFDARRFAICSAVDTERWTFCEGGKKEVSEHEFERRYRARTGQADLAPSLRPRWNQGRLYGAWLGAGASALLGGLAAWGAVRESDRLQRIPASTWPPPSDKKLTLYWVGFGYAAAGAIGFTIWGSIEYFKHDGRPDEHAIPIPSARRAVDRYNSTLREQLQYELGPRTEAPAKEEPAVRVTPYLSPLGAGIAGTF